MAYVIDTAVTVTVGVSTSLAFVDLDDDRAPRIFPDRITVTSTVRADKGADAEVTLTLRGPREMPDGRPARDRGIVEYTPDDLIGMTDSYAAVLREAAATAGITL